MRQSAFISYFCGGIFLANSVPHLLVAATGRRNLTPFGQNSSPFVNLLWSAINVSIGYPLILLADRQAGGNKVDSKAWEFPFEIGRLALAIFGVLYARSVYKEEKTQIVSSQHEHSPV